MGNEELAIAGCLAICLNIVMWLAIIGGSVIILKWAEVI